MLEDIDKGKLVTYAAVGLLVLAIALRLHAHGGGGGAPPATVSLAPTGGTRGAASSPVAAGRELWVDVAGGVRRPGRILEYRQQHGGFRSLDELKEVSGIGDKRFEALRKSLVP